MNNSVVRIDDQLRKRLRRAACELDCTMTDLANLLIGEGLASRREALALRLHEHLDHARLEQDANASAPHLL